MVSIRRNFLYNILLNVSRVVFPLITAPYISRILEPTGVGLYNFANTYSGYFALFALLGIPVYGVREVSKIRESKEDLSEFVSDMYSISIVTTVMISIVYVLTIFCIPQLTQNHIIFLVSGFILYVAPLRVDWYFSGLERFKYITIRVLVIRFISIICMFVFVRTKQDLLIYVIIGVSGTIGGDIWNYVMLCREGIKPKFRIQKLKRHINSLCILFASSLAVSVYSMLDTIILGFMTDYSEVGYYNNANNLSRSLLAIVTSLSAVAIPRISYYASNSNYKEIDILLQKSFSIVSFLSIPMMIGVICVASQFVPLFFGPNFEGSIIPLIIMSGVICVIGFNNITGGQILIGLGCDKLFLKGILTGSVCNVILNIFMIRHLGAIGASISSLTAEIIIFIISFLYVKYRTPVKLIIPKKDICKTIISCGVFYPLILGLSKLFSGWLLIISYVAIGFFVYILLQILMKNSTLRLLPVNRFIKMNI